MKELLAAVPVPVVVGTGVQDVFHFVPHAIGVRLYLKISKIEKKR